MDVCVDVCACVCLTHVRDSLMSCSSTSLLLQGRQMDSKDGLSKKYWSLYHQDNGPPHTYTHTHKLTQAWLVSKSVQNVCGPLSRVNEAAAT